MSRLRIRGIRLRLALALLVVVAGSPPVVYLIVVPSLEAELIDAKVDQLEEDASSVVRTGGIRLGSEQAFAENAASLVQARVVVYLLQDQLFIMGDSNTSQLSVDVARDPIARRASLTGRIQRGTVERGGRRFGEVAVPLEREGVVVLLSDSLADPISSLNLIERRLLFAGLIALIFAVVTGYAAASLHARRIRRLERMRVRLEKLDRARSEFIANASHELRTPLFSLGGFLELMDDEDVDDATRQEFLATMREQVDRLAKLATDLLDLSRLDAGRMRVEHEPVDLGEVARTVAAEVGALAERSGHAVEVVVQGRPVARADELRVLQVVRALVDNALTHTPPGTHITLRAWADKEHASLDVEDDGPGVAPEHAPHVFDRFYRGEGPVASGSGLGLAIARELAQMMHGNVELESRPGRTLVRVVFGAAPTSVAAPEA